ncbi:alpha/beta fold hydrolase [Streptomyces sp. NPDC059455]|uniref:alpha/beta fold hydrolase n=1 Tax=Streptomyces sp. NPDC059455 TaxID=3346837 RepID=UPI003690AC45
MELMDIQAPPEGAYAEADGVKYHYVEMGEGSPAIFLHGGGPGCTGWSDFGQVAPLFAGDRRCFLVDILQYGKSAKPVIEGPMWDYHAAKTVALMDTLGIDRADFVCNSWGGTIALNLAAKLPRARTVAGHHRQHAGLPRSARAAPGGRPPRTQRPRPVLRR